MTSRGAVHASWSASVRTRFAVGVSRDDPHIRNRTWEIASQRRRFGYRRIKLTNAAIANSLSVSGTGDYYAKNHQTFRGDVAADTTVALQHVTGAVDITTAALGNSASYEIADAQHVGIENWQRANIDPTATAFIELDDIDGEVNITTAAIANSLSVSTLPDVTGFSVESKQENNAYIAAITTVDLANIVGDVTLTSAAIGNSVNISNLPN